MSVELFNTTINRIVEVPDEAVDGYLAQAAYRKVRPADRQAADTITISRADYEAAIAKAVSDALAGAEAAKDQAVAEALASVAAGAPSAEAPV